MFESLQSRRTKLVKKDPTAKGRRIEKERRGKSKEQNKTERKKKEKEQKEQNEQNVPATLHHTTQKLQTHLSQTNAINPAACTPPFPKLCAIALLFSSHPLNAFNNCTILSLFPCLTSLILTFPIFTSLSNK